MRKQDGTFRQLIALLTSVFLFVLIIYTLEKTGVPRSYSIGLSAAFALALYAIATLPGGTTRADRFLTVEREVRPGVSALASVSLTGFPFLFLMGGALFLAQPGFLVVLAVAVTGGIALASLLFGPQFNATRAADISEMLHMRFAGTLAPRLYAAAYAPGGLILAASGIAAASYLVAWFFAISGFSATLLVMICVLVNVIVGGISSITRFAATAALLALVALNLPLLVHTVNEHGFPIGHLTAGVSALQPAFELEQQLKSLGIPVLGDQIAPVSSILGWSAGVQILAGLVVLAATAGFPALIQNTATSQNDEAAGTALRRALLYTGLMIASLFALMAFTKIGFYQSMLGLTLSEARVEAPFVYSWSGRDSVLVRFCGESVASAEAVLTACSGVDNHIINLPDFAFDGALMLAAAPDIATLPLAFTAIVTIALIVVLLAFTSATVFAVTTNLVSAYYVTLPGKVASGRMFMIRLCLLATLTIAVWIASGLSADPGSMFLLGLSLTAATTVPGLLGGFYLRNCSTPAVSTAIGTGFGLSVLYFVLAGYGIDFTANTGDELIVALPGMGSPVPAELAAIFTLPLALLILLGMTAFSSMNSSQAAARQAEENGLRETTS